MSGIQKLIKYMAISFAIFLIFSIVSGIINATMIFGNVFNNDTSNKENLKKYEVENIVSTLFIDVKSISVVIKEGTELIAESNNKNINIEQERNKLYITQKKASIFNDGDNNLIIYVPTNIVFNSATINTGAGIVDISSLKTNKMYLSLGAGNVKINNLDVLDKAEISGGAGSIIIDNCEINNLDLDMGVGKLTLNGKLSGENKIDSGIGGINVNLMGTLDNYKIRLDKGIGSALLDNSKMENEIYYGTGTNLIDIDGGIGSIKINFNNNR